MTKEIEDEMAEREAIDQFAKDYGEAFVEGNVDRILEMLTDDFVALTADKAPIQGKPATRTELESDLSTMDVRELNFNNEEVLVSGRWASAWGISEATIAVGEDVIEVSGKYLWILHHENDRWLLARDSASANG